MSPALLPTMPLAELDSLRRQLDQAYERWFDGESRTWAPAIDVDRGDKALTVHADIPGVDPANVRIEVEDGVLTISGEHEERKERSEKHYLRRERRHGSFSRSMALPAGVDPSKIKAKTKDGVVEVTIPLPDEHKKQPVTITPTAA
jgi:HSP20 family protein